MDRHHSSRTACYENPILGPDAWADVENKRPVRDGAKASLICRFACAVRHECPFGERGTEIIANGGGWFGADGKFIKPPDDMLEVNQAAAYVGLQLDYFQSLIRLFKIPRYNGPSALIYLKIDDVRRLSKNHGPKHGTSHRYELHLLRGEVPCAQCIVAYNAEVQSASLLRRGVR